MEDKNQLKGEALFIRAYLHSLMVELYGSIPYISTTDYIANTTVSRMSVNEVYENIIADLTLAETLLGGDITGERVRPYDATVNALLARVYLYTEQWELAANAASNAINATAWESDLNKVFLKNSSGSIWQFKPENDGDNTYEGNTFILTRTPSSSRGYTIGSTLLEAFETGDQRRTSWIGEFIDGTDTWYYSHKYKERTNTGTSLEYSVLFRLAEQFLIRAEARAQLDDILGSQGDINVIRSRAGLPNTTANTTNDLLDAILRERRVELFTEHGHRWFDLKRTGNAANVLRLIKSNWKDTDILMPIPEKEILVNPNLLPQNDGY